MAKPSEPDIVRDAELWLYENRRSWVARQLVEALASAVRELRAEVEGLRKDRERLDRLLNHPGIQLYSVARGEEFWASSRDEIDAAMSEAKGE